MTAHEFWQEEAGKWVILRCHKEHTWSTIRSHLGNMKHVGWSDSAEEAVQKVQNLDIRAELSTDYEFHEIGDKFRLLAPIPT